MRARRVSLSVTVCVPAGSVTVRRATTTGRRAWRSMPRRRAVRRSMNTRMSSRQRSFVVNRSRRPNRRTDRIVCRRSARTLTRHGLWSTGGGVAVGVGVGVGLTVGSGVRVGVGLGVGLGLGLGLGLGHGPLYP